MCAIHELKSNNATILLADGTSMGGRPPMQSALSDSDLSGRIGCMMRSMGQQRRAHAAVHGPDAPHPPVNKEQMLAATSTDFSAAAPAVAPVKADPLTLKTLATSCCCGGEDDVKVKPARLSGSGGGVAASELILKARMASAKLHSYLAPTNNNHAAVRRTSTTTTNSTAEHHTHTHNVNMIHASLMVAAAKTKTKEVEVDTKSKPSTSKTTSTTTTTNNITASALTSTCSEPQAMNVDGDSDSDDDDSDDDFDFFEPSVFAKKNKVNIYIDIVEMHNQVRSKQATHTHTHTISTNNECTARTVQYRSSKKRDE
jgi:hypothetical protein